MNMLEKYILYVPNRFFAQEKEMYVSFNIAGIPVDMDVTNMMLVVPLPVEGISGTMHLHDLTSPWDELHIQSTRPSHSTTESSSPIPPGAKEVRFSLTHHSWPWRFRHLENHGVYVRLEGDGEQVFLNDNLPYLLVGTV